MSRTNGILICSVLTLVALGTVMVFSVISARATTLGVGAGYLFKHVLWVAIAGFGLWVGSRVDYRFWQRHAWAIGAVALALLVLVLVPGIGTLRNGARRWIRFGPVGFQPSEFAKLALLVVICRMAARRGAAIREFRRGFLPCMALVGLASALILLEPDFGTAALVGVLGTVVILAAGGPILPVAAAGAVGAGGVALLIWRSPGRLARVFAFLNPWAYRDSAGYQVIHSLTALGSGGLTGRGLGGSLQKLFFLPEADTDFILSIIGEELGLIGAAGVVVVFAVLVRQGMRISERAPDAFGSLLAFGITMMVALQALIHIAVVTASMPTKGIALPFVSAGGSSLLASMAGVGILLNIGSKSEAVSGAARRSMEIGASDTAVQVGIH